MPFTISHLKQLSDGNGDGTAMGVNSADAIGFYGTTVATQRAGGNQTAISQANIGATLISALTLSSTPPSGISTFVGSAMNITWTGAGFLSSDFIVVNKPTNTQAGLGFSHARAGSTAAVATLTFVNLSTTATLTPTPSESYQIAAIRGG